MIEKASSGAKRGSSEEGGLLFAALYQQEPMPEDGAVFRADGIGRWSGVGRRMVQYGNKTVSMHSLRLRFATIDPALKGKAEVICAKQRNGPTGVVRLNFFAEKMRFENRVPKATEAIAF